MRHKPFYNIRNYRGIGAKLFVSFFLIGIVPLFFLTYTGFQKSRKIVKYHELKTLLTISQLRANDIEKYLKERKRNAINLLLNPIILEGSISLLKEFNPKKKPTNHFLNFHKEFKKWLGDYQSFTQFKNLTLSDLKGEVLLNLNHEKSPYVVKRTVINDEIISTNFVPKDETYNAFSAYLSLPVIMDNQVLGYYTFEIDFNSITTTNSNLFGLEITGNIHIGISQKGETIFPNFWKKNNNQNATLRLSNKSLKNAKDYNIGKNEFQIIEKLGNEEIYSVINTLKDINVKIMITKTWSEIFDPIMKWEKIVEFSQIILLIFIIIFSTLISKYFSRPLVYLTNKIRRIEKTNQLEFEFSSGRRDEVGDLAHGFKRMVEKLAQAQKDKGQFVHVLCHDLKNPIAMALTVLDLIKFHPEKIEKYLPKLTTALNQGLSIIDLVRTMMSLDEGKLELKLEKLNLSKTLDKSTEIINQKLNEKNIELNINVDKEHFILAEETSVINSVINNLLTNSIKFSLSESKIDISSIQEDQVIIFKVRDYGVGMPKNLLDKVFESNETTSRAGTSGEKGTGFGMPLVKKFVEAYGGSIKVWSKEKEESPNDHGTEIIISFKRPL